MTGAILVIATSISFAGGEARVVPIKPIRTGPDRNALWVTGDGASGLGVLIGRLPDPKTGEPLPGSPGDAAVPAEVQLINLDGVVRAAVGLDFTAQVITRAPDGEWIVAGAGRIARIPATATGTALRVRSIELPVLDWYRRDPATLARAARRREEAMEGFERLIANARSAGRPAARAERSLEQLKARSPADFVEESLVRVRFVTGVAATERHVFVVLGETSGFDYSVWRLSRRLRDPVLLEERLAGCCGNLDITAVADGYAVAENSRHRVLVRTAEGAPVRGFGGRARGLDTAGFGGCCNPMNLVMSPGGDLWTMESEGIVRRFAVDGAARGIELTENFQSGCYAWPFVVLADGGLAICDRARSRILLHPSGSSAGRKVTKGERHAELDGGGRDAAGGGG